MRKMKELEIYVNNGMVGHRWKHVGGKTIGKCYQVNKPDSTFKCGIWNGEKINEFDTYSKVLDYIDSQILETKKLMSLN